MEATILMILQKNGVNRFALLCVILVATVFCACSNNDNAQDTIPYSEEIDQSVVKELIVCNAPAYSATSAMSRLK